MRFVGLFFLQEINTCSEPGQEVAGLLAGESRFLPCTEPRAALGLAQPAFLLGKWGAFPGVMELEREADHSPPFTVEINNK